MSATIMNTEKLSPDIKTLFSGQVTEKFTPGPWSVNHSQNASATSGYSVWPFEKSGQARIATVTDGSFANANANLIAAAPDLLAALKAIVKKIADKPLTDWTPVEIVTLEGIGRQAIAKANG